MHDMPRDWVLRADALSFVPHGFFTRRGGVSPAPFDSLNCSLSSSDRPENLAENRRRVAASLGVESASLLGLKQIHSPDVVTISHGDEVWGTGRGPKGDALVTDRPDWALGVITADCGPVLFASRDGRVVGAAHAGWRGAASGVLEATVSAMRQLGAGEIVASVGPCIAPWSYEVGADMRDSVLALDPAAHMFFIPAQRREHFMFDLPGYCLARLRRAGLKHISALGLDTLRDSRRFFSHRRRTLAGGGAIGHQISAIRARSL
ncbi:peptidoglycan editing factor PgeF [Kozakia baliensis]|uniref:Purine nucleoside phosphorylase n=1 Tax=Kozakia baliensis TaxID=153496 RepID=A0A1D8UVY5_9PROT|nr:peptidoglycan editing factor PgeF [Kozakia baliensis]AOX17803.1 hypothetical protein A0U89_12380 [Kozakia baliensis]GBR33674.1 hypothetical protein AA0488_2760 [Kozakia baliensis NRIC 0488]GEL64882.1 laccase domain protein [Kozakia baliensis]